jgi:ACS family hexuronate transporter-like MFS transporter
MSVASASRKSDWTPWVLAIGATLTMAVSYFDRHALAVLQPSVMAGLDFDKQSWGFLVSAFSLAYLVGSPISGWLIDRIGARRGLLGAVLAWTVVAALHSIAPTFGTLFALRIALGLTESPSFPGASQTIHRALPPEDRARGFGLLFTGSSVGAMIAAPSASALAAAYGWRTALLVTAIAGLVWIPMWIAVTFRAKGRALLERVPAASATAELEPTPSLLGTLAMPAVLRACLVVLATAPMASFVLNWSAGYLVDVEHLTQKDMGTYLWVPPVLYDVGSLGFGHLASVHLRRTGKAPRVLFLICGLLGTTLVLLITRPGPWATMVIAGVALAGVAGMFAIFTSDMLSRVPSNAVSKAGGMTAAAQSLGYVVASPLIGRWIDATDSYTGPIVVLSALVLPGCATWLLWRLPEVTKRADA